jgi:hypothetical protein
MGHLAVSVCSNEVDYSDLPHTEHDWSRLLFGEIQELIPQDTPEMVHWTHYVDAKLMHDITSVLEILDLWYFHILKNQFNT